MKHTVYMDNAATTRLSKAAYSAMLPFLTNEYGNPSSIYNIGQTAKKAIERARETVACSIGAEPEEIYFTSSGTESDNWAVKSAACAQQGKGRHIISTAIEHPAVLNTLRYLEKNDYTVTYLPVDKYGQISISDLEKSIRPDTILITIMTANNEVGTILPITDAQSVASDNNIIFHTDAVQAVGHIAIDVKELGVDMLSFSAHKFGGSRGVGALYVRKGLALPPLLHGGGQERGKRASTENVAGIVSMATALEEIVSKLPLNDVSRMRDKLIHGVLEIPHTQLTGDPVNRLPGNASFVFKAIEGESLILMLDSCGICASSGSACSSGSLDPSHVLIAMGLSHETAHGSLRLTLNEDTTDEDVDYVLNQLPPIVAKLRNMSPLWNDYCSGN